MRLRLTVPRWLLRMSLAAVFALQFAAPARAATAGDTPARAADPAPSSLLWITLDVTTASRTGLVQGLAGQAGFDVRHFEYPVAGATPLTDDETTTN